MPSSPQNTAFGMPMKYSPTPIARPKLAFTMQLRAEVAADALPHFIERLGRHAQAPAAHEMDQPVAQIRAGHQHENHDHDHHERIGERPDDRPQHAHEHLNRARLGRLDDLHPHRAGLFRHRCGRRACPPAC